MNTAMIGAMKTAEDATDAEDLMDVRKESRS